MTKTIFRLCILILVLENLAFAGIIRHDVSESKYLELAAQKQFDCVGKIFKDTTFSGSCVLIGNKYVLTAAHIFVDVVTKPDTMKYNGAVVVVYQPVSESICDAKSITVRFNDFIVHAKRFVLHPFYRDSSTKGNCDIAIIELEHDVNQIILPSLNIIGNELHAKVIGAGYGASGIANKPETVESLQKKIAGENTIDSIGGYTYQNQSAVLYCDFDHPTANDCNKIGASQPLPLEYICSGGDSGGGLFRILDNKPELIGICSGSGTELDQFMKTGYYGQIMSWTRISIFKDWIENNTK